MVEANELAHYIMLVAVLSSVSLLGLLAVVIEKAHRVAIACFSILLVGLIGAGAWSMEIFIRFLTE